MTDDPHSELNALLKAERRIRVRSNVKRLILPALVFGAVIIAFVPIGPVTHAQAVVKSVVKVTGKDAPQRIVAVELAAEVYRIKTRDVDVITVVDQTVCVETASRPFLLPPVRRLVPEFYCQSPGL